MFAFAFEVFGTSRVTVRAQSLADDQPRTLQQVLDHKYTFILYTQLQLRRIETCIAVILLQTNISEVWAWSDVTLSLSRTLRDVTRLSITTDADVPFFYIRQVCGRFCPSNGNILLNADNKIKLIRGEKIVTCFQL